MIPNGKTYAKRNGHRKPQKSFYTTGFGSGGKSRGQDHGKVVKSVIQHPVDNAVDMSAPYGRSNGHTDIATVNRKPMENWIQCLHVRSVHQMGQLRQQTLKAMHHDKGFRTLAADLLKCVAAMAAGSQRFIAIIDWSQDL
jgi:hypothetical protein